VVISVVRDKKEYDFCFLPQKTLSFTKITDDEDEKEKFISRVLKIKDEIFKGNDREELNLKAKRI